MSASSQRLLSTIKPDPDTWAGSDKQSSLKVELLIAQHFTINYVQDS